MRPGKQVFGGALDTRCQVAYGGSELLLQQCTRASKPSSPRSLGTVCRLASISAPTEEGTVLSVATSSGVSRLHSEAGRGGPKGSHGEGRHGGGTRRAVRHPSPATPRSDSGSFTFFSLNFFTGKMGRAAPSTCSRPHPDTLSLPPGSADAALGHAIRPSCHARTTPRRGVVRA